jgi:hypothetical protein
MLQSPLAIPLSLLKANAFAAADATGKGINCLGSALPMRNDALTM